MDIKSILLDIPYHTDKITDEQFELLKRSMNSAMALGALFSSRVIVFSRVYESGAALDTWLNGSLMENARIKLVEAQQLFLQKLCAAVDGQGCDVLPKAIWSKNLDEAIEKAFPQDMPDLVIQSSRHHLFAVAMVRQPDEWRMIRMPRVPVLLQQQDCPLSGKVLLALDVGEIGDDQVPNDSIVTSLKNWCEKTNSELHLVNAYPSAAELMAFAPAEWTVPQVQSTLKEQHEQRLHSLAAKVGIDPGRFHAEEGPVAEVIDMVANRIDANLVVIMSHCRRGVSGFFVGNTAETVFEHTRRNLLVVKPSE